MVKTYTRINWKNYPDTDTPMNERNLNAMDSALDTIDDRVVLFDTTKANQSDLLTCLSGVDYNTTTGVFTFTFKNGTTVVADLNIEKIPVSFSMNANGVITMTTSDGTQYTADVGELIKTYSFVDSSEIDFTVTTDQDGNKTVTAGLVAGSITGNKLEPNFLANCQAAEAGAEASAEDSEAWAVGTRNGVPVPSTDPAYNNYAKYYAEHSSGSTVTITPTLQTGTKIADYSIDGTAGELYAPTGGGGTSDYDALSNKPSINNVTLSGNKTSSELGLVAAESGKGLSSNDYTTTDKNKLAGIESGAEANVQSDWNQTDNTADDYIKNKPTSLGHTMVNNAGTALTQRTNLQTVGGLNATDDSVNDTTKITDVYEEVPWATWNGYPSEAAAAQAHPNCVVTGAPDCDGDVEIEMMHLAWTNLSPTSTFAAQTIELNTDTDWDFARIYPSYSNSNPSKYLPYVEIEKGTNGQLNCASSSTYGVAAIYRNISADDDTHISFGGCAVKDMSQSAVELNQFLVPIMIYTYKNKLTAKIQAIAHDVSTEASKCMLNENTSVADALKNQPAYSGISNIIAEVKNGVLIVDFSNTQGATANSWNSKGVLPAGYRPSRSVYGTATETNGTTALIYVSSAGEIQIRPKTANTGYYGQIVCGV